MRRVGDFICRLESNMSMRVRGRIEGSQKHVSKMGSLEDELPIRKNIGFFLLLRILVEIRNCIPHSFVNDVGTSHIKPPLPICHFKLFRKTDFDLRRRTRYDAALYRVFLEWVYARYEDLCSISEKEIKRLFK
jgi:hypothetical protein